MDIKQEGSTSSLIVMQYELGDPRTDNADIFSKCSGLEIEHACTVKSDEDGSVEVSAENEACNVDNSVGSSVNHEYDNHQVFSNTTMEHCSPDSKLYVRVFANEKSDACSADVANEDVLTIVENSTEQNDFNQHEEATVSSQTQEKTRRVYTGQKVDKSTSTEGAVISKSQSFFGGSSSITEPLVSDSSVESSLLHKRSCHTQIKDSTLTDDVIEIDDSSEEEVLDPLMSKEPHGTTSQSTFNHSSEPQTEQELSLQSGVPTSSGIVSVLLAFERAVDDWYSKLSVHRPLMDSEILESAQQLARHFNYEFSGDAEWLRAFKDRHDSENLKSCNQNRVANQSDQHAVTNRTVDMTSLSDSELHPPMKREITDECDDVAVTKRPRTVMSPTITSIKSEITVEEGHFDFGEDAEHSNSYNDKLQRFEEQLIKWYCKLTEKHKIMVAASILEHKAVEIALSLNLSNFRPTKTWVRWFISRHGMWCINGRKRFLFFEPKAGVLKSRYDVEFDAWYYMFPLSPDLFMDYERDFDDVRINANQFLSGLFDWYVAQTPPVSAQEILTAEAKIADAAGLPSTLKIERYYCSWVVIHNRFYKCIEEAYSLCSPVLLPRVLKNVAIRWAKTLHIKGFCCHPTWMRRYLQINGLIYREGEVVDCYRFDPSTCELEIFDRIFQQWLGTTANGNRWLREALCYLDPEKVVPEQDPLQMVEGQTEELDQPLKIVSSFTLNDELN